MLAVAALATVSTSACSKDEDEADARPSRTTTTARETTTTLDPVEAEKQAVIAAHEAARQARIVSSAPPSPDPNLPAIAATHTGPMLDRWVATVTGLQLNGFALRYPENSQAKSEVDSVRFEDVDGQQVAYVDACEVGDSERFGVTSGSVLSSGVVTLQVTEAFQRVDGVWKLAERVENSQTEGVTGCAVD